MAEQLTAPAHKFSAALAKNIVRGDTTFIHYPQCIVGGSEAPSPGRSPQLPAAVQAAAVPKELRQGLEA
eukprot:14351675-Heterocapsa_arctica.AAC.1